MTNFRGRRGPGFAMDPQDKSEDEPKPALEGRRTRKERHIEPGSYRLRHGGFRTRRRLLGVALLTLVLVGTILGMRPLLSGEEVAADGDGPGSANQQQELVSSQDQPGGTEGDASEAASAEAASAETKESRQASEPSVTSDKEKLGEFSTDYRYSDSKDRKYNLRLSSQAVDGTVLGPGEVFSMNDNISGLDYKEAKVCWALRSSLLILTSFRSVLSIPIRQYASHAGFHVIDVVAV